MRFKLRLAAAAGMLLATTGLATVATTSPAGAVAHQLCDNGPTDKCLNAWDGGSLVKTFDPNAANDNFDYQPVKGRCQSGTAFTTANCPLSGTPAGLLIVQIQYFNVSGSCIGDNANSQTDAKAAQAA